MKHLVPAILLLLGSTFGAVTLKSWLAVEPARPILPRVAGKHLDPTPVIAPTEHCNRVLVKTEKIGPGPRPQPAPLVGSWPAFRGATRDNVAKDNVPLANEWSEDGPPRLWEIALGDGHAGAAVYDGRVYVFDYDEEQRRDALRCFDLINGNEIWRSSYPIDTKRNHGMSRTVPAVNAKFVITVGPKCQVMCVDRLTGEFVWGMDLVREYGTTVPLWYTAQCPLIDGDTVVLAPAGKDLLMGVDCATGEILWRTPNPQEWNMSHASIMPMAFAGQECYVYAALGGLVCVTASGEQPTEDSWGDAAAPAGEILWQTTAWDKRIVAPCPVQISPTELFITSGHGAGSAVLELSPDSRAIANVRLIDKSELACEQQTPVLVGSHLFGVLPKDVGQYREQLVCWHPQRGGVWRSGPDRRFGLGPWVVGDGKLYVLDDRGTLTMVEATPDAYKELGRARILDGRDAWGPIALAGKRLILRDSTRMVCLDIGRN